MEKGMVDMAKRNNPPEGITTISNPRLLTLRTDAYKKINNQIEIGNNIQKTIINSHEELEEARKEFVKWNSYNLELLKRLFDNESIANEYSKGSGFAILAALPLQGEINQFRVRVGRLITNLESIQGKLDLIPESIPSTLLQQASKNTTPANDDFKQNTIFIVHGHDESGKEKLARYIEKLELIPIILHEMPNSGKTIIEKLEKYSQVNFAIILLSPDDICISNEDPENKKYRARQNVILELGYFIGKLGRNHVCALYIDTIELPSDYDGVLYIPFDEHGAWKLTLAREIREAGILFDMNSAL
jgi:predicted nucleotide-binding protein